MTVTLAPEQERIVSEKVASGSYGSPVDVVGEALRLLEARDAEKLEMLRNEIAVGVGQKKSGDVTNYASGQELAREIMAEGRRRMAEKSANGA